MNKMRASVLSILGTAVTIIFTRKQGENIVKI